MLHCWVLDPDKKILTAFRLEKGKYQIACRLDNDAVFAPEGFPGLAVKPTEV